jgi:hypothetical protein
VYGIVVGLDPHRRWRPDPLATFEDQHRVAFGHVRFAGPIAVMEAHDPSRPLRRIRLLGQTLRMTVSAERVDDGPQHHDAANGRIEALHAGGDRDRCVEGIVGLHRAQHRQVGA